MSSLNPVDKTRQRRTAYTSIAGFPYHIVPTCGPIATSSVAPLCENASPTQELYRESNSFSGITRKTMNSMNAMMAGISVQQKSRYNTPMPGLPR